MMPTRIDAHQHFWRITDEGRGWPPPGLGALYRDFLPPDLAPLLAQHGIERTLLVQSLPNEDDTQFMLDLAWRHRFIGGVVGWVDLKGKEAPQRIAALACDPLLKGLRPMLQDLDDDAWIDDAALAPAAQAMLDHALVFDALVLPRHLEALLRFAERFPALPIVIDHGAKPAIQSGIGGAIGSGIGSDMDAGGLQAWRDGLARLAALPSVHCKLSGLVTEAGPGWRIEDLRPYTDAILALFGPERVIWGSDWPVLHLAADYAAWIAASEALLEGLDDAARGAIFGGNAQRLYRIE